MTFALLVSLLLLVSTAILLYQFWTGALAPADDLDAVSSPRHLMGHRDEHPSAPTPTPTPRYRIDSAA